MGVAGHFYEEVHQLSGGILAVVGNPVGRYGDKAYGAVVTNARLLFGLLEWFRLLRGPGDNVKQVALDSLYKIPFHVALEDGVQSLLMALETAQHAIEDDTFLEIASSTNEQRPECVELGKDDTNDVIQHGLLRVVVPVERCG